MILKREPFEMYEYSTLVIAFIIKNAALVSIFSQASKLGSWIAFI